MTRTDVPSGMSRPLGACLLFASLLVVSACSSDSEPVDLQALDVAEPRPTQETIRSMLGKITLDAAAEGQEVLGVRVADDQGVVNLHYAGPAERYVACDNAGWLVPGGGVVDVDLSENAAFETIDNKGDPVSVERWVRLDALTNVRVSSGSQQLQVEPRSRYIVSMVTEVYNLNQRIGHKAERLEFESGGSAVTSTGHRCKSTGALEELMTTAAS